MSSIPNTPGIEQTKAPLTREELEARVLDLEAQNKVLRDIWVDVGGVGGCQDNTGIRAVAEIERLRTELAEYLTEIARLDALVRPPAPPVRTAVPVEAAGTGTITAVLRDLLAKAGEWPTDHIQDKESGYYRCPLCEEGEIEAELVHRVHGGLAGVQVYGFGDQVTAMEQLMPVVVWHLPAILTVVEAAVRIKRIVDGDRTKGKEVQEVEDAIRVLIDAVQTVEAIQYRRP